MEKIIYNGIIEKLEKGYKITVLELPNVLGMGFTVQEALIKAEYSAKSQVFGFCKNKLDIPIPVDYESVKLLEGQKSTFIIVDLEQSIREFENKAVKKNLSIPSWLNEAAIRKDVNFSQVLKDALIEIVNKND